MKTEIRLIEDDAYPENDISPEYDFAEMRRRAQAEGREYRGVFAGRGVRLAPDVADAFPTAEAVNEALRQLMKKAA